MRMKARLLGAILFLLVPSTAYSVEYRTFFGADVIKMDTELSYSNGSESYEYTGLRLRYGIESDEGGSAGFEFIPALSDDTVDTFGQPFELELGPSLGGYITVGKLVYVRLGVSFSDSTYTDLSTGLSDSDVLLVIDVGLGFNYGVTRDITLYGEWNRRTSSEADYSTFFSEDIDNESDVISLGFNYKF